MIKHTILTLFAALPLSAVEPFALTQTDQEITVASGGAEFSIPSKGGILIMPEEKRKERPVSNVIMLSDASFKGYVLNDGRDNKIDVLENSGTKKIIRMEYSLSESESGVCKQPFDSARLIVYYGFFQGIPGVVVSERLLAVNPVSLFKFNVSCPLAFEKIAIDSMSLRAYPGGDEIKACKGKTGARRYILGEKASGHKYYLSRDMKIYGPPKGFFIPFRCILPSTGLGIPAGKTEDVSFVIGRVLREEDVETLNSLCDAVGKFPAEGKPPKATVSSAGGQMFASPLRKEAHGDLKDWGNIPVILTRGETKDYRPIASNKWTGPQDLSFTFKCAYDSEYLYMLIDVADDILCNKFDNASIWLGDAVQFAVDPLCQKDGRNVINFGVSQAGKKPVVWGFQHPNVKYTGDISKFIKNKSRARDGGIVYELAIPWDFFKPFEITRGKMGFNFTVIDQDTETNYESWMGITDGLFGGRDPSKYQDLNFGSPEEVLLASQKTPAPKSTFPSNIFLAQEDTTFNSCVVISDEKTLPARLNVSFNGKTEFSYELKKGFNNFASTLHANGMPPGAYEITTAVEKAGKDLFAGRDNVAILSRDYLASLASAVERKHKALEDKIAKIRAAGKRPDYLMACSAMIRHFANLTRHDIDAKEVIKGHTPFKVDRAYGFYIYDRAFKNLSYTDKLTDELSARADRILAGEINPIEIREYPKGIQPVIADGGLKVNGDEILLIGPNTWTNVRGFNDEHIPVLAKTGMNYFNIFYVGGARRDSLIKLAEDNNLYFSWGATTAEDISKPDTEWSRHLLNRMKDPNFYLHPMKYLSPNMVFSITFPEQFRRDYEKTGAWAKDFQGHLKRKFGTLEKVNTELSTSFKDFSEIDFSSALQNPALKYESFVYRLSVNLPVMQNENDFKVKYFGRPSSAHYSTHYNIAGLDPLVVLADFEGIWETIDIIGFDGGVGLAGSPYAIDFSKGTIDCDLARSFYPDKPIANNENHIIIDGVYEEYTNEETYVSNILTYFHGLNAGSVWVWAGSYHSEGEYAFTRANTYHATIRCAIDLRRFPEEIAAFRKQENPPFRILHSLPSMTDRDVYVRSLYSVYEGSYFTGWPVRFLSERMLAKDDFKGAKIVIVPEAKRVSEQTFAALAKFADKGGKVLVFGKDALTCDEYGKAVPAREKALAKFIRKPSSGPVEHARELGALLESMKIAPPLAVTGKDEKTPFGVEYRSAKGKNGERLLYLLNLNRAPAEINLPGGWFDLIEDKAFPSKITLKPLEFHLLKEKK